MTDLYTHESPAHVEASYWLTHFFMFGVMEIEIAKICLDHHFLNIVQFRDPDLNRPVSLIEFSDDMYFREQALKFMSFWHNAYRSDYEFIGSGWELDDEYRQASEPNQKYIVNRARFEQEKRLRNLTEFLKRCPQFDWVPPESTLDDFLESLTPEERKMLHEDPRERFLKL